MADADDAAGGPGEQPGGWLPPSAPGGGESPTWQPQPPARPEVEGLPSADSPVAGVPQPPPAPAFGPPPAAPPYPQAPTAGWQGQPPSAAPTGWPQQPGWYQPPPARPTNGAAVAALVLGISGIIVTLMFAGFLFIVSMPCSIAAWVLGVKGKRAAAPDPSADPRLPGGRGMAQAGLICGIVGLVLAVLGIAFWALLFSLGGFDVNDFETQPDENLFQSALGLVQMLGRG